MDSDEQQRLEQRLKKIAPLLKEMGGPGIQVPPALTAAVRKAFDEKFAGKELTRAQMRGLMLAVLNEQSSDAADLFRRLSKAGFKLAGASGEGVLFGVLAELESTRLIAGDWRESGSRDVKYYHVTKEGESKLQVADEQITAWSKAVRVTD